jgi:transposase
MENTVIRKRLNTYKSDKGQLRKVDDEVVIDVLRAWENWQGSAVDLRRELGLSKMQLVVMIQKAKRLVKKGVVAGSEFKEIAVAAMAPNAGSYSIELSWGNGRLIRFSEVGQLLDFLKRASYDTLFSKAKSVLEQDPYSGHLFLFINRSRTSIKCLYYDGTGFVIVAKRMERGLFSRINPYYRGKIVLTEAEFALFFEGADLEKRFVESPRELKKFSKRNIDLSCQKIAVGSHSV